MGHCLSRLFTGVWCESAKGVCCIMDELIDGKMWCELNRALRLFVRFEIVTCMGCGLVVVEKLLFEALVACNMLENMSDCLEFRVSCMGVGPKEGVVDNYVRECATWERWMWIGSCVC